MTSICGTPRGTGGITESSNLPSKLQGPVIDASPQRPGNDVRSVVHVRKVALLRRVRVLKSECCRDCSRHLNSRCQPWIVKVVFVFLFSQGATQVSGSVRKRERCLNNDCPLQRLPIRETLRKLDDVQNRRQLANKNVLAVKAVVELQPGRTRSSGLFVCMKWCVQSPSKTFAQTVTKLVVLWNRTTSTNASKGKTSSPGRSHAVTAPDHSEFQLIVDIPLAFRSEGCHNHKVGDEDRKGACRTKSPGHQG